MTLGIVLVVIGILAGAGVLIAAYKIVDRLPRDGENGNP